VNRGKAAGFSLLEFLLALSLLLLLVSAATSVFRRSGERFASSRGRTASALGRVRLIHQLENDLLNIAPRTLSPLSDGVRWQLRNSRSFCVYRLDGQSGRLHRLLIGPEALADLAELDWQTVLLENVAEFSLGWPDSAGPIILHLRFRDEDVSTSIPFGP
jgi:type II secretory pathway component PulJ